ncbi:sulfite exporter TauE/SafE family protein [Candidatus Pacearchaeota archaeon]|nr:sulfite exporter TauE/SafE family protein [Candidatus Pacearchaeota archaeon]
MKKEFAIKGMTCNSCKERIEKRIKEIVNSVHVDFSKEIATVDFDETKISVKDILSKVKDAGYDAREISSDTKNSAKKKDYSDYAPWVITALGSVVLLYFIYTLIEGMNIALPEMGEKASLFLLFLVGILTGFHCVSMCGGFMISYTAKNAQNGHKSFLQHIIYGSSKTISYAVIGALFGLIGSVFLFTPALRGGVGIFAGIFMIFYAMSMFGFKWFRKFQFNPKFLTKAATSKHKGPYFGPMMTGLLNGLFIACGPLQALYIYAAGTADPIRGGLALAAFGLGTLPVMLGFGGVANVISHKATKNILKISAVIVLILGIIMLNRGLALTGSGYDLNSIMAGVGSAGITGNIVMEDGYQVIKMDVTRYGWTPDKFTLQKDVPVKWEINGKEITGCNNAIQVPKLGLEFDIKKGKQTIEFTPTETGVISWSCWMGMIPGTFIVTEDGTATTSQIAEATTQTASAGGSCGGGDTCGQAGSCGGGCGGGCGG